MTHDIKFSIDQPTISGLIGPSYTSKGEKINHNCWSWKTYGKQKCKKKKGHRNRNGTSALLNPKDYQLPGSKTRKD